MRRILIAVLVMVGCGKSVPPVPVESKSMTYLEASKIVEDEEKELAEVEAKLKQRHEDLELQLTLLRSLNLSDEERDARKKEIVESHEELTGMILKLISNRKEDVERA